MKSIPIVGREDLSNIRSILADLELDVPGDMELQFNHIRLEQQTEPELEQQL